MTTSFAIVGANAKNGAAEMGPPRGHSGPIMEAFGKIFPEDTRKILAQFLGLSPDGAKKKLQGDRDLHIDELFTLLRTDEGFSYLAAGMAGSQARWWKVIGLLMEAGDVQTMQIKAQRKLARVMKGAIDADADLSAARARADALLFQDEDFYRSHADALSAMARLPHRTLAPAAGKGRGR